MRERVETKINHRDGDPGNLIAVPVHVSSLEMSKRDAKQCVSNDSNFASRWYNNFRGVAEGNPAVAWAIENSYHGLYVEKTLDAEMEAWDRLRFGIDERFPIKTVTFTFYVHLRPEDETFRQLKFT